MFIHEMSNKKYHLSSGLALLIVVILTFALSIIALTFLTMININIKDVNIQYEEMQALYTAEAAVEEALWRLNNNMGCNFEGELDKDKKYEVKCGKINSNRIRIEAVGKIRNKKLSTVSIEVGKPIFPQISYEKIPQTWKRIRIK